MEGERYKKTPELAAQAIARVPELRAEGQYIVFKRWDKLEASDDPLGAPTYSQRMRGTRRDASFASCSG